jgi:hypothetical protein
MLMVPSWIWVHPPPPLYYQVAKASPFVYIARRNNKSKIRKTHMLDELTDCGKGGVSQIRFKSRALGFHSVMVFFCIEGTLQPSSCPSVQAYHSWNILLICCHKNTLGVFPVPSSAASLKLHKPSVL